MKFVKNVKKFVKEHKNVIVVPAYTASIIIITAVIIKKRTENAAFVGYHAVYARTTSPDESELEIHFANGETQFLDFNQA